MDIKLAYGKEGLTAHVPDKNLAGVVRMNQADALPDPEKAVWDSLDNPIDSKPLSAIAEGRSSAVIVISDITRPVPNKLILPPLLQTLEKAGIPREKITILIATGIHRPNLGDELVELVGKEIANNYNVVNHYSEDPEATEYLGKTESGIPIYINKHYLQSDLKILTGLVEPHLMAGFSGGRKAILPGISSLETMKFMHGYRMIQKDETCNGRLQGNPFHEGAVEVARQVGVDFILNVTLDEDRKVTGIFAGELEAAHEQACDLIKCCAMVQVDEPADIVLTTGGGYPLDNTLYQAIKGLVGCLDVVKEKGTVILAAKNAEGAGSKDFVDLLKSLDDPMDFYKITMEPNYVAKDQWMIQEMVNAFHRCTMLYKCDGISDEELKNFLITSIDSVEQGIDQALKQHGPDAKILVIPEGPYVIPHLPHRVEGIYSWQTSGES